MSVTSGVVSRIEVTGYAHGAAELLGIQVDAAINSGNSGGPAFNDRGEWAHRGVVGGVVGGCVGTSKVGACARLLPHL